MAIQRVATGIKPGQVSAMQKAAFENVFKPAQDLLTRGHTPGDLIAEQASKSKLDVLVMGSFGFGVTRHTIMGSVATRVATRCRTALLLVREK